MSSSKTTTDLETIKKWAEEREGKPCRVRSTGDEEGGGVLRIDFPGFRGGDTLEEIPWEEWYATFTDRNLAFLYQEETAGGKESRFFKLIANKGEENDEPDHGKEDNKEAKAKEQPKAKDDHKAKEAKKDDHKEKEKEEPKAKEDHKAKEDKKAKDDQKEKEEVKAKEDKKAKEEKEKKAKEDQKAKEDKKAKEEKEKEAKKDDHKEKEKEHPKAKAENKK